METPRAPTPEAIPELEEELAETPEDPDLLWRLGAAHRAAGELEQASSYLQQSVQADPTDPNARLYLAMTYEDQSYPSSAIAEYNAYLELAPESPLAEEISARIRLLRRQELRQAIRRSMEREEALTGAPPSDRAVAVFPFLFAAENEELRPLGRALAQMLATDLAQPERITVLERVQIQALMDELALTESGVVDAETAARSGYLVGAGQIVQGQIQGTEETLELDAAVLRVEAPRTAERRPVTVADEAERLFDLEKELAFEVFEAMGVELTPAERERVNQRWTENLQAVLAYGMGLEASDRGNYAEAAEHFAEAARLDPGFVAARQEAEDARTLARAEGVSTTELVEPTLAEGLPDIEAMPVPEVLHRNPVAEVTGTERVGEAGTIIEIVIRTGGGQ
jgi:tetratricopeptide (TPR) repeat protein